MQTSKKRIMGALGLASVAAMTVAAYNVPTPVAYAQTSQDVPLTVNVIAKNLSTKITGGIRDGSTTAISPVEVQVTFSHAHYLDYTVSISQDGTTVDDVDSGHIDVSTIEGVTDQGDGYAGIYTASIDTEDLLTRAGLNPHKKAEFTFYVEGSSASGALSMGDSVTFNYGQIAINPEDNTNPDAAEGETNVATNEDGDPIIAVESSENVTRIHSIITGPDGNTLFEQDNSPAGDITNILLPFAEHNAQAGWYTLTVVAYDENGEAMDTDSFRFYYAPLVGLPNTGGSIFAGLNIGRTDFLVSGLLVFGIAAVAGILLMNRNKKSSKRTRK